MLVVGLTGGIGAGKSTVVSMLASKGAVILDADVITRELQQPGTPVFAEIVETFGSGIVAPDGTLDRPALGAIVFADPDKRRLLEGMIWPRVAERIAERMAELSKTDEVVVLDIPLLLESGQDSDVQKVVVVAVSPDTQIERLVARGMDAEDAKRRIAAQVSQDKRLERADYVLWNDGSVEELAKQVDEVWTEIVA